MALIFKNKIVVGVSITPGRGLEVAQIDYNTRTLLKYGRRPLDYDLLRCEITDRDKFKDLLSELLKELDIPTGSEIVLNFPTARFEITDYTASHSEEQIVSIIEEDLNEHPVFQELEPAISTIILPISTMAMNKVASTALLKEMLIEIVMQIKDLQYKVIGIDTSIGSTLNALIYNNHINFSPETTWVMLLVENNYCRVLSMQGSCYVDYFEEHISIGEVLGDEENYSTVVNAVAPILKNLPSQCLYVISKTDVISAKKLAGFLTYDAQIVHQEDNVYNTDTYMELSPLVDSELAKQVSLEVIGVAAYKELKEEAPFQFNLFNSTLGDIYLSEQPLTLKLGEKVFVLSLQNMLILSIVIFVFVAFAILATIIPLNARITDKNQELQKIDSEISIIQKYLNDNSSISADAFNEGDEIRIGLVHNKNIYSYYSIIGTEIPKKLWLTSLELGKEITIEGQADNLESVYGFFRNIRDYNPKSNVKLQQLALSNNSDITPLSDEEALETDSLITSATADFYEFRISNAPEVKSKPKSSKNSKNKKNNLPDLESID